MTEGFLAEVALNQDLTEVENSNRRAGKGPSRPAKKGLESRRPSSTGEGPHSWGTVKE